MRLPSKDDLKRELCDHVAAELSAREQSHRSAVQSATHEEAKPENDKDTRALEQTYFARGEAMRAQELREALAQVQAMSTRPWRPEEPVAIGALVTTEESAGAGREAARVIAWLAPYGGGARLDGGTVQVVTPKSPFGRALLGRRAGDETELVARGKPRLLTIVSVA
jgi:transcription elongation GreA/GreB family factor